jgi:hypothetical protein
METVKIGEILELTQTEKLSDIAKERLTIGEKAARQALKAAGCYSISGKRGWFCEDDGVLDKSIYDFAPVRKIEKKSRAAKEISKAKAEVAATKEITKEETKEITKKRSNVISNVVRKRASFDLDIELLKRLKVFAVISDRNVYEVVETAIRKYLNEEGK